MRASSRSTITRTRRSGPAERDQSPVHCVEYRKKRGRILNNIRDFAAEVADEMSAPSGRGLTPPRVWNASDPRARVERRNPCSPSRSRDSKPVDQWHRIDITKLHARTWLVNRQETTRPCLYTREIVYCLSAAGARTLRAPSPQRRRRASDARQTGGSARWRRR